MDRKKLEYIEETGLMFEQMGMTRMAGRVFGYLIVSDNDAESFEQIRQALHASKGSISGTTKQLIQSGLIEPLSLPGDRKTYFRVTTIEMGSLLKARMKMFGKFSQTLSRGRELSQADNPMSDWLLEAATFYSWIGDELDKVIDKWHDEKDSIIKNYEGK